MGATAGESFGDLALDHLRGEDLRRFAANWVAARGGRLMPMRRDFDPMAVPRLLGRLWLCDFLPAERRFVYRLAGEEINDVYGRSLKGLDLEQVITAGSYTNIHRRLLATIETPGIVHVIGRIYIDSDRLLVGERVILPLADEAGEARFVLGATVIEGDWEWDERAAVGAPSHYVATLTPLDGGPARPLAGA